MMFSCKRRHDYCVYSSVSRNSPVFPHYNRSSSLPNYPRVDSSGDHCQERAVFIYCALVFASFIMTPRVIILLTIASVFVLIFVVFDFRSCASSFPGAQRPECGVWLMLLIRLWTLFPFLYSQSIFILQPCFFALSRAVVLKLCVARLIFIGYRDTGKFLRFQSMAEFDRRILEHIRAQSRVRNPFNICAKDLPQNIPGLLGQLTRV